MVKDEYDVILDGLNPNNITSILQKSREVSEVKRHLEEIEEMLRNKVKAYLKERNWEKYFDKETKIAVSINKMRRESFDKEQLKLLLNDRQYAQVVKITTYETLRIITPEVRKRMNYNVLAKKK